MLNIYICEDDVKQMNQLKEIITDLIVVKNLDMQIAKVTQSPHDILDSIKSRKSIECGAYFLDVELDSNITGIELGSKIREYDPRAYIVYITIHPELLALTFEYKVEALDYISKDCADIRQRVAMCLKNINKKYHKDIKTKGKGIFVKSGEKHVGVNFDDILFFETSSNPHRIVLYTYTQRIEFYGNLSDIYGGLDDGFLRAHRSIILNTSKVKNVEKNKRKVILDVYSNIKV